MLHGRGKRIMRTTQNCGRHRPMDGRHANEPDHGRLRRHRKAARESGPTGLEVGTRESDLEGLVDRLRSLAATSVRGGGSPQWVCDVPTRIDPGSMTSATRMSVASVDASLCEFGSERSVSNDADRPARYAASPRPVKSSAR